MVPFKHYIQYWMLKNNDKLEITYDFKIYLLKKKMELWWLSVKFCRIFDFAISFHMPKPTIKWSIYSSFTLSTSLSFFLHHESNVAAMAFIRRNYSTFR